MHKTRIAIIGSGLGGLACGVILSKNGFKVTVLEKERQAGGCLQCFERDGAKMETGMHFIGSAAKGQTLNKLMKYMEIEDKVKLQEMDRERYDIVEIDGKRYESANGKERFVEKMSAYFPNERKNIERYCDTIETIAQGSPLHTMNPDEATRPEVTEYQLRSVNEVIDETIGNETLRNVLVGNLPLYAGVKDKTPFTTHAFIHDFYNQSSYRVAGGSDNIAKALIRKIEEMGGEVLTGKRATKIICDDTKATGIEINGGEEKIEADCIISDTHPKRTLELINSNLIRPAFRNRINAIEETIGSFSVYIRFKDNEMPYMNSNFYGYSYGSPWGCETYDQETWPKGFLYMHFCHKENPEYAKAGVILSYMTIKDVEKWKGTKIGRRGEEYNEFKEERAEKLLQSLETHIPGTRSRISKIYTSTPLTYLDYTGTEDGGMYGIAKDIHKGAAYKVAQRTRIPNVYQTGQNINSHGILGVIVGAIVTCSELLTYKTIFDQIRKANE